MIILSSQYHPHYPNTYLRLVSQWITWALFNNVTLKNLDNLPYGEWFFNQAAEAKEKLGIEN